MSFRSFSLLSWEIVTGKAAKTASYYKQTLRMNLECVRDSEEHFVIGLVSPVECDSEVHPLLPLSFDDASSTCIPAPSVVESSDLSSCWSDNLVQSTALLLAAGELRAVFVTAINDASDAADGICV